MRPLKDVTLFKEGGKLFLNRAITLKLPNFDVN